MTAASAIAPLVPAIIAHTPAVLRVLLADLDFATLQRPNPEGWSIKDIVAHLHDMEGIAFTERIARMLAEDAPLLPSGDAAEHLAAGNYAARGLDELLSELAAMRAEHVVWLLALTPQHLARPAQHHQAGIITVADIVHQWAYHDLAHLHQVLELLQAQLVGRMGNTHMFYTLIARRR